MTEVDYSPEAAARYRQTLARVSNWAVDASSRSREYTHPFDSHQPSRPAVSYGTVPDVRPDDSISLYDGGARRRQREREEREHRSSSQPRSYAQPSASSSRPGHQRSYTHDTHHTSRSRPPPAPAPMYYAQQPGHSRYLSADSRPTVVTRPSAHGKEVILPIPRPGANGHSYAIYPGGRVEVSSPADSQRSYQSYFAGASGGGSSRGNSRSSSHSRLPPAASVPAQGYSYGNVSVYPSHGARVQVQHQSSPHLAHGHQASPTKKKEAPLLMRLLTGHIKKDSTDGKDKPRGGRRRSY